MGSEDIRGVGLASVVMPLTCAERHIPRYRGGRVCGAPATHAIELARVEGWRFRCATHAGAQNPQESATISVHTL